MHKHLHRVYTLTLDLVMLLLLLLAAPVLTHDSTEKPNAGRSEELKGKTADVTANMIERRAQKRNG